MIPGKVFFRSAIILLMRVTEWARERCLTSQPHPNTIVLVSTAPSWCLSTRATQCTGAGVWACWSSFLLIKDLEFKAGPCCLP